MMREIKFRAWDKKNKQMFNVTGVTTSDKGTYFTDDYVLEGKAWCPPTRSSSIGMQYTGLKDKNGVEIYEGDIVSIVEVDLDDFGEDNHFNALVCFGQCKHATMRTMYPTSFSLYYKKFYRDHALLYNERFELEVIGNIYENGDLLK